MLFIGAIVRGYSGGPLVDSQGRVVGVVFSNVEAYPTVSYAIPADDVGALIAATEVERPDPVRNRKCPAH